MESGFGNGNRRVIMKKIREKVSKRKRDTMSESESESEREREGWERDRERERERERTCALCEVWHKIGFV